MSRLYVDHPTLVRFLDRLGADFGRPGRLYLIGETTQLYERWRAWTSCVELTAEVAPADRPAFDAALAGVAAEVDVEVVEEFPGDVVPLPEGYAERARRTAPAGGLALYHFDPYSVAIRFLARGDEADYRLALLFLEHGWIRMDRLEELTRELLQRFSFATIQQDPAEFRRKYKGLLQMWRAGAPAPEAAPRRAPGPVPHSAPGEASGSGGR